MARISRPVHQRLGGPRIVLISAFLLLLSFTALLLTHSLFVASVSHTVASPHGISGGSTSDNSGAEERPPADESGNEGAAELSGQVQLEEAAVEGSASSADERASDAQEGSKEATAVDGDEAAEEKTKAEEHPAAIEQRAADKQQAADKQPEQPSVGADVASAPSKQLVAKPALLPPDAHADWKPSGSVGPASDEEVARRCAGTKDKWCGPFLKQQPTPWRPPPVGNRTCLWNCTFVGVCDASRGWCRCPAGWTGDDCGTRMKRPCSQFYREFGRHPPFEPYSQPNDYSRGGGLTLMCAGYCDEDRGLCYCPSDTPFGRVPAGYDKYPYDPPKRRGRPMGHQCQPKGGKFGNFGQHEQEKFMGPQGWCTAEQPSFRCSCLLDGYGGANCDIVTEQYCMNQCNGHGTCDMGWCKCDPGWYGQDCAFREQGTAWSPGREQSQPWLKPHVRTPAAMDPPPAPKRRRPLIYIYELPPLYNSNILQYRASKHMCTFRKWGDQNQTEKGEVAYALESGLVEMMAQSEHRTLDPEEADFFYLPIYTSCFRFPVVGALDFPFFHGPKPYRTHLVTNMYLEVYHYIRSHFPYWDRKGGRDHILLETHDEGSCVIPAAMRSAIVLSHWGKTEVPHESQTGFIPDKYSEEQKFPLWLEEGAVGKIQPDKFPCYDPRKDLLMPQLRRASELAHSPVLGAPERQRDVLAFSSGRVQPNNLPYSKGTRQFMANVSAQNDWWGKHRIWAGEGFPPDMHRSFSEFQATSVFCFAPLGDGHTTRFDDAVVHGCIPVVIQDGIQQTFSNLVDVESFSIRVAHKDIARIPEILKAVSQERIQEMRRNLRRVWRRWLWAGLHFYGEEMQQMVDRNTGKQQGAAGEAADGEAGAGAAGRSGAGSEQQEQHRETQRYDVREDDALSTLMQWLYTRRV